jgi:hypothetical protein
MWLAAVSLLADAIFASVAFSQENPAKSGSRPYTFDGSTSCSTLSRCTRPGGESLHLTDALCGEEIAVNGPPRWRVLLPLVVVISVWGPPKGGCLG